MSSVGLDSRMSQIHLWNQLKEGKIAFISNIFSEEIGTIIQEQASTQITLDRPPDNLFTKIRVTHCIKGVWGVNGGGEAVSSEADNEGFIKSIYTRENYASLFSQADHLIGV